MSDDSSTETSEELHEKRVKAARKAAGLKPKQGQSGKENGK